jgi:hypothetical protein
VDQKCVNVRTTANQNVIAQVESIQRRLKSYLKTAHEESGVVIYWDREVHAIRKTNPVRLRPMFDSVTLGPGP